MLHVYLHKEYRTVRKACSALQECQNCPEALFQIYDVIGPDLSQISKLHFFQSSECFLPKFHSRAQEEVWNRFAYFGEAPFDFYEVETASLNANSGKGRSDMAHLVMNVRPDH